MHVLWCVPISLPANVRCIDHACGRGPYSCAKTNNAARFAIKTLYAYKFLFQAVHCPSSMIMRPSPAIDPWLGFLCISATSSKQTSPVRHLSRPHQCRRL
eukprot:480048-Pleurochrysis_carterae.AAC.3